jgi:uncharacterized protein
MKFLTKAIFISLLCINIYGQNKIAGYWDGRIQMINIDLPFQLQINESFKTYKAFLSIPQQGLKDYQLQVFTYNKGKVHFELPGQAGTAQFDGKLKGDSIKGTILQAGIKGTFSLGKTTAKEVNTNVEEKSKEPLPYSEEEVAFKSGRILLSGTLTRPQGEGPFAAVILLTGSGPQDRDENIYGFKVFEKIADYLTRKGFAVLRYDDRGVGGSTGNTMQSTTEEFADDALATVEFLKKQSKINVKKIGFLGHSEGGIVAPLAASRSNDVAFMVLMSGFGVNGGELLLEQQKLLLKSSDVPDSIITENLELQKKINETLTAGKDINVIEKDIRAFTEKDYAGLSKEIKASIKDKKAYIDSNVRAQMLTFNNSWFRFFIKYDPIPVLEKTTLPVLMTFGELDLQVPAAQNKSKMEEALTKAGNKNFKSVVFPKASHLYQEAKTGSPSEYSELPKEFVPGFLETISDWITQTIK